ncbi:EpsG family protein [Agarivorans sp. QJM3NY_25]|uniref:EpsG family protein n=1 Tax=Agarivorans sp. QJM3NY_25 TaxID=3421430 RepID=UPI003D7E8964
MKSYFIPFIIGLLLCLLFSLISYSIQDVSDFHNYRLIIQNIIANGIDFDVRGGEFGFHLLVYLLTKIIGSDERVVHYFVLVLTNFILFTALFRVNPKNALFVFITAQIYYLLMITPFLTRQLLSFSLILLSISFLRYRYLIWTLAFFTHFSALIPILGLLCANRLFKQNVFFVLPILISIILSFTLSVDFFHFLVDRSLVPSFLEPKITFYLRIFEDSGFDKLALLFVIWIFLLLYFYLGNKLDYVAKNVASIYFTSALLTLSTINIPILPTRLGFPLYYCLPIIFIVIPFSFNYMAIKKWLYVFTPCVFVLIISLYRVYINDFAVPWLLLAERNILMSPIIDYFTYFI